MMHLDEGNLLKDAVSMCLDEGNLLKNTVGTCSDEMKDRERIFE